MNESLWVCLHFDNFLFITAVHLALKEFSNLHELLRHLDKFQTENVLPYCFRKSVKCMPLFKNFNQKESVRKIFWKNILKFLIHFDLLPFSNGKYSCIFSQWNLIQQKICKYYPVIVSVMERNDISYYKRVFLKEYGQRNRC